MYSLFTTFTSNFLHDFSLKLPLNREWKTLTFKIISENCVLIAVFFFSVCVLSSLFVFLQTLAFLPVTPALAYSSCQSGILLPRSVDMCVPCVYTKIIIKKKENQGTWSSCRGSKMGGNDKNIVFMYAFLNKIKLKTLPM